MASKYSEQSVSVRSLIEKQPPVLRQRRIQSDFDTSVWGINTRQVLDQKWRKTYLNADNIHLPDLQERLIKRALLEGLSEWNLNLAETYLYCPVCGSDNIHQAEVVDTGDTSEGVAIAYQCEQCPSDLHLQLIQHKGLCSLFWNAEQLLKDYGVYEAASALLKDAQYERFEALSTRIRQLEQRS